MSEFVELPGGKGEFVIRGDLDRHQVPGLWQQRLLLWSSEHQGRQVGLSTVSLSLREVGQADTAGLALLVALQAEARQRDIELRLLDLPPQLKAAAEVSHLDQVLSVCG